MNRYVAVLITILAVIVAAVGVATASQLIYRPIDPAFGGDPLNGSWLLGVATAQTEGGGSPGFTIDFPDFGSIPQDGTTDPSSLPPVN